ncbi:MAG TPA: LysE family transporter [Paraburkholderia sp.]|jgi:threonine/homoserine/homoserine lactone efflux protein|nr:LysE family transporter [Paraburkholderia sp.]
MHDNYLPLLVYVVVSTISPGGATAMATASGAQFGYRRSVPCLAGTATGLASMAAFAAAGLAGVLLALPSLQVGMKATGSLYLLWLALRVARSGRPSADTHLRKPMGFAGGVWMLWHNPKAWAVTLGAAASFGALAHGPLQLGALLGASFGMGAVMSLSVWCIAGLLLARLLKSELQWRVLNATLALLLVLSIVSLWVE